jgi:L-lactate dehydrogenase complex protein LldG
LQKTISDNFGEKMDSRKKILQSLQNNLTETKFQKLPEIHDKDIYRDLLTDHEDLLSVFMQKIKALNGEIHLAHDLSNAAQILVNILDSFENKNCITQFEPLILEIIKKSPILKSYIDLDTTLSIPSNKFALYSAGISIADFLVARTGSITLRSNIAGGRRLTILPPTHIIIAKQKQLVPSLDEVLRYYSQDKSSWSFATIISGPSRTADIEKELVLGAHGPKRLITIILP